MKGAFLTRLALYELEGWDGEWYCLLEDLKYRDEDGTEHVAPAGTMTDFASVPRILWSVFPKIGKHTKAAVVHDYECTARLLPAPQVHARFKRMLKACDCSWFTVQAMWSAVRTFGPKF